jgi:hypothetical protein
MKSLIKIALLFAAGFILASLSPQPTAVAQSQTNIGRCTVTVPPDWGALKGVSDTFGMVFEDSEGTLRAVKQMPCGLGGAPNVALEIHRR